MSSIPGQSMCDLWSTKWHWDRFLSEYSGFPTLSFHQCSIFHIHSFIPLTMMMYNLSNWEHLLITHLITCHSYMTHSLIQLHNINQDVFDRKYGLWHLIQKKVMNLIQQSKLAYKYSVSHIWSSWIQCFPMLEVKIFMSCQNSPQNYVNFLSYTVLA